MKDNRKLTEKEQKRIERLKVIEEELKKEGYEKTDLTVSTEKANALALITSAPFIIILVILFFLRGNIKWFDQGTGYDEVLLLIGLFISIPIHELIHGITFSLFSKNGWKDIDFGIVWSSLTPYCTCATPISKISYYCALLMPCIVLGIIPSIIAIITRYFVLLFYGLIMIMAAGGDLLITWLIFKNKTKNECIYLDHPTECGVLKFEKRSE
jgi:hypothetical protein